MTEDTIVFGDGFMGKRVANWFNYESAPKFDVLNGDKLRTFLDTADPMTVISTIGRTGGISHTGFNIDWCEYHKDETFRSNVTATLALATECSLRGIYFVHFGSGCVYDGDNDGKGFSEEDEPNFWGPQHYAKTKITAERDLKMLEGDILQLRIRMPIDDRSHPRNLIDKLKAYPKVIDIQNSMTTVPDMMKAMDGLIERSATGIYNLTNPGTISAAEIMQLYGAIVDPSHKYDIMSREELDKLTLGKRSNCVLNTDKLKGKGLALPEINEAVQECLRGYNLRGGGKK